MSFDVPPTIMNAYHRLSNDVTPTVKDAYQRVSEEVTPLVKEAYNRLSNDVTPTVKDAYQRVSAEVTPYVKKAYRGLSSLLKSEPVKSDPEEDHSGHTKPIILATVTALGVSALGALAYAYSKKRGPVAVNEQMGESKESLIQDIPLKIAASQEGEVGDLHEAYHLRFTASKEADRFLKLHMSLWEGSQRYQGIIKAIEERKGAPVAFMDRETALKALKGRNQRALEQKIASFEFRACWCAELNAVILIDPEKYDDSVLGSTMAFEITNGYQNERFGEIHKKALSGQYDDKSSNDEEINVERAAHRYAFENEAVESEGRSIHDKIITEAISSGRISEEWHWSHGKSKEAYKRIVDDLILSEYGQSHITYYKQWYIDHIAPRVKQIKQDAISERMKKLRDAQSYSKK